ncbi:MAG TPA: hypothetical protein ACFYEK_01195 [Candidatus Wunengus sp. YC60]|uniref:hypothetical protein n=1 Tax=Candidatus Wunengus sp. YC60 TaxID=3367697 RepID=UPI0040286754
MNIDIKLLKKQKKTLVKLLSNNKILDQLTVKEVENFDGILNLLDALQDNPPKHFPNGFTSWTETHHEIVKAISINPDDAHNKVNDIHATRGTGGIYEFAEELTDKFEKKYKDKIWDGEYFDVIGEFIEKEFSND